jgi:hypothetical protein
MKTPNKKFVYDEELTYEEYLKVVDSIKNTFNYYAAFFLDGYFDTLIETIKEHHHIVMDEEKLKTIVHSLLFDIDSLRGSDYGRDFYATGLFHSPLLTLKDLYGKPVIIGYPENHWIITSFKSNLWFPQHTNKWKN